MNKNEYFVEIYEDGHLINTTDFDDFTDALRYYASSWDACYCAEIFKNVLDLDGNIVKTEKFVETWVKE